jgi:hypothetical protein
MAIVSSIPVYQHYAQRAFLERWNRSGKLYLFDKEQRLPQPKSIQSARSIFGLEDMQTVSMENAFFDVERSIGYTDHSGEIKEPAKIQIFAKWIALHLVRNRAHAPNLAGRDYQAQVDSMANSLVQYHAAFQDFKADVLITGDNPVVPFTGTEDFFIAPLSPRRCLYLMPESRFPTEDGGLLFRPSTINQFVYNAATRHCLSFDKNMHLP